MRIWLAPWEDSDGDLHDQSYLYVTVDNGRWMIEQNVANIMQQYQAIQSPGRGGHDITFGAPHPLSDDRASQLGHEGSPYVADGHATRFSCKGNDLDLLPSSDAEEAPALSLVIEDGPAHAGAADVRQLPLSEADVDSYRAGMMTPLEAIAQLPIELPAEPQ